MTNATYNGWKNRETWTVKLWMDNDEGAQTYWAAQAQEAWNEAAPTTYTTREEEAAEHLAEQLKDDHEARVEDDVTNVFHDLLTGALENVNWIEIARNLLEDADKERG